MKDRNITSWIRSSEIISTQYGLVTGKDWCDREAMRIIQSGGRATVITKPGRVAIRGGNKPRHP